MGRIATKLRREFQSALGSKVVSLTGILEGQRMAEAVETVDQLIQKGFEPVHAIYTDTTNLASRFAEEVTALPPLHCAFDFLEKAQNTYMPGYPPMSPLTVSYYVAWTLFDVRFGHDRETIGDCLAELSDLLELHPIQVEALGNLRRSRMGIYKVMRRHRDRFILRELLTGHEFDALIPSGFRSGTNTVVLTRLLPSLQGQVCCHIATTTPYVLVGQTETDWINYFGRHQIFSSAIGADERLRQHLKHGVDEFYWSEFIFNGFLNYRSDAIFLAGTPDEPKTQPQHNKFDVGAVDLQLLKDQMAF